jgi:hypothetical protein
MSTTYALTELINEINSSLNNKMYSIGVFIDLKKAFDTVDHELLCKKCICMVSEVWHTIG